MTLHLTKRGIGRTCILGVSALHGCGAVPRDPPPIDVPGPVLTLQGCDAGPLPGAPSRPPSLADEARGGSDAGGAAFQVRRADGSWAALPDLSWVGSKFVSAAGKLPLDRGVFSCAARGDGATRLEVAVPGGVFASSYTHAGIVLAAATGVDVNVGDPVEVVLTFADGHTSRARALADALPLTVRGDGLTAQCRAWTSFDAAQTVYPYPFQTTELQLAMICREPRLSPGQLDFGRPGGFLGLTYSLDEAAARTGATDPRQVEARIRSASIREAWDAAAIPFVAARASGLPPAGTERDVFPGALSASTSPVVCDATACRLTITWKAAIDVLVGEEEITAAAEPDHTLAHLSALVVLDDGTTLVAWPEVYLTDDAVWRRIQQSPPPPPRPVARGAETSVPMVTAELRGQGGWTPLQLPPGRALAFVQVGRIGREPLQRFAP